MCVTLMVVNTCFMFYYIRFENLSTVIIAAICGIISADFASGFVHWVADTWGSIEIPIIGKVCYILFIENNFIALFL